jgi:hypothetical protein
LATDSQTSPTASKAALAASAAVALGLGLALSSGTLDPLALAVTTGATALAVAAAMPSSGQGGRWGSRATVALLALGIVASVLHDAVYLPGVAVDPGRLGAFRPLLAAVSAVLLSYLWRGAPSWACRLRFPAVLVLCALMGAAVIRASPSPGIDVWHVQQGGSIALAEGRNPYSALYPNVYGPGTDLIDPALLSPDGRFQTTYQYMPLTLLLDLPGALLGDVRWSLLAAVLLAAWLIARLGRGLLVAELAAAFFLLQPQGFTVIELGWNEPLAIATLLLVPVALSRAQPGWILPGIAAAVAASAKQYAGLLLVPYLACVPRPARWKALAVAAAGAIALALPFVIWGPSDFLRGVVLFQILQPFRADALSWPAAVAALGGGRWPAWIPFPLAAGLLLIALRRPTTIARSTALSAAVWLVFVITSKQAFMNYYWLAVGMLCAGTALLATGTGTGKPET